MFYFTYIYIIRPTYCHHFLSIEILQETGDGGGGRRVGTVSAQVYREGNNPAVFPYIYIIRPTSYHSFLGYRDITGDGERGGGGRGAGEIELSPLKCKYT